MNKTIIILILFLALPSFAIEPAPSKKTLQEVSKIYSASMMYIFNNQSLINQTNINNRKAELFGEKFINNIKRTYKTKYKASHFPSDKVPTFKVLLEVMEEVMEDNKTLLLDNDIKFKGFIPAVFAFQISEKYTTKGIGIKVKFTNDAARIRNKFNSPDEWESSAIIKIKSNNLPEYFDDSVLTKAGLSQRYMVPVKMKPMCLTCHGTPKDNSLNQGKPHSIWESIDKTGFEMEGWKINDFGGAISVSFSEYEVDSKKY